MGELESEISQNVSTLSDHLRNLIKTAEMVQGEPFHPFKGKLSSELLRLRPSANSFSLVSYNPKTPQLGRSNLLLASDLERELRKLSLKPLLEPGRPTPEKALQSWLIREALEHCGIVKPLNDVLGGEYWFVSDELAIEISRSKKVVADLLLVRVDAEGLAQLVNVELKYTRAMEAFKQVIRFRAVLEHPTLRAYWREFSEIMTGQTFRWQQTQEAHGVVVWPKSSNPARAQASEKRRAQGYERVDLIGFQERYILECENLPASV